MKYFYANLISSDLSLHALICGDKFEDAAANMEIHDFQI
jgi:hypothetical protein